MPDVEETQIEQSTGKGLAIFVCLLLLMVIACLSFLLVRELPKSEEEIKAENEKLTKPVLANLLNKLSENIDQEGKFIVESEPDEKDLDAWGKQVRFQYAKTLMTQSVCVQSAGHDGIWDTEDDLAICAKKELTKTEAAKKAFTDMKDKVMDKFKGEEETPKKQ